MRAVVFDRLGGDEVLELADIPNRELKQDELLVRLSSIGLNRADLLFPQGRYFSKPEFRIPIDQDGQDGQDGKTEQKRLVSRLGFEGAGRVVDTGVDCRHLLDKRVGILAFDGNVSQQGCLAEYAICKSAKALATPEALSDDEAGSIWVQYLTAWGGVVLDGGIEEGQTLTVTAASSSVGIAAIQAGKSLGAKVIATTTSDDKIQKLRDVGADLVINTKSQDYVEQVKEFTEGKGTDVVFDAVAGPFTRYLVQGAGKGSKLIIQGMLDRRPMDIHAGVLMKRLLTVKGFTLDVLWESPPLLQNAVDAVTESINSTRLTPIIAAKFSLDEFSQAYAFLKSNKQFGKVVICP